MKLVYLTKYPESVFWSQVFELLRLLKSRASAGGIERIVLLAGIEVRTPEEAVKRLQDECDQHGIELCRFRYHPIYPGLVALTVASLRRALQAMQVPWHDAVIHVRDEVNAFLLFEAGMKDTSRVLVDVRAANVEEVELYSGGSAIAKRMKLRYKKAALRNLTRYRHLNVVSERLRQYVFESTSLTESDTHCSVIPSLAGASFRFEESVRIAARAELGLVEGDITLVFGTGGSSGWQQIDRIVGDLRKHGNTMLNLSRTAIEGANVINRFVDYRDVPRHLMAADVAVLWREDNIVNQVASPVKFAEYVCCGLPVIVSSSVPSASDYVSARHRGLISDEIETVSDEEIRALTRSVNRGVLAEQARAKYGVEAGSRAYLNAYDAICRGSGPDEV